MWNESNPLDTTLKRNDDFNIHVDAPLDFKTPVMYPVKVKIQNDEYKVHKRYKQFLALYTELKKTKFEKDLPGFPDKILLGNDKSENIWYRVYLFRRFVRFIMKNEELRKDEKVIEFLKKE